MPDGSLHVFFKIIIKVLSYKINFIIPRIHLNQIVLHYSECSKWIID